MDELLLTKEKRAHLSQWREKQKLALELMKTAGHLLVDRSVELILFRRGIYDSNLNAIIDLHESAQRYISRPVSLETTLLLARTIERNAAIRKMKIDLGKLTAAWYEEQDRYANVNAFIEKKLLTILESHRGGEGPRDVVLYGFGRIGRLVARRILQQTGSGEQLILRAVVVRPKMKNRYEETFKRVSLLMTDSIHGRFPGTFRVSPSGDEVVINGNVVRFIYADAPDQVDYSQYGIENALLIDNTGVWRDKEGLSQHLRPGIDRILLTAPGKDIPNIVKGVNDGEFDYEEHRIICAASCTTNAICPIIKVIDESFGIESGHIETIHAYTVDQNLLDNFHKKPRRGRAAAINMVLTTTGAATAVARVMPHLAGKLTGNAVRVPVPDVSLAILSLQLRNPTVKEEVNAVLKQASIEGALMEQIHYSEETEYSSSHAIGMTTTSVIDAPSTIVSDDGRRVILYAWYDNEYGYACQVVRLAKVFAGVRRAAFY